MLNKVDLADRKCKTNMVKIKLVIAAILIFQLSRVFGQREMEAWINNLIEKPEYKNATLGLQFIDLESGNPVFQLNENKLLIPASVLKAVTTASAIEILGPDYRFKTKIGYQGSIKNNILKGDLVIVGNGDPTLGSVHFQHSGSVYNFLDYWVEEIKTFGIQRIDGDLVLDASDFESEKIPPTWIWEDIGNYYGAGSGAFSVYDNLFTISFKTAKRAGELSEIVSIKPEIKGLNIINEVKSSEVNKDLAYVFGGPLDKNRIVRGTLPKGRNNYTIKAAMPFPEEILAADLLTKLAEAGIFIGGKIKFEKADRNKFQVIYTCHSPELVEIVTVINHKSINLFAEQLVKQIAFEKTGFGSRTAGLEIISEFWASKALPGDHFFMEDGSGLSHFNAVSPAQLNYILEYMFKQSGFGLIFQNTLPAAGTGTLVAFNNDYFPGNSLQAKSGSMTRVRCYAGYLTGDSNKKLAFSILFNHFDGTGASLSREIENLLYRVKTIY
jgi:D-alanyl-D-alanine carboxypeptidase/D-alanyl-D-alanine-endopeptidase (penicillin-binding protein 4)